MAVRAAEELGCAGQVVINFRSQNDFCYSLDLPGAVGFSAARLAGVVFILFPQSYPIPAAAFTKCIGQMPLHCADKNRFVSVFGQGFNFVQIARVTCSKKGPLSKPVSLLLSKAGVKNCRYGFHDVFRGPDVSPASLRHFAAELHFLAKI